MNRAVAARVRFGLLAALCALAAWPGAGGGTAPASTRPANSLITADPAPNDRLAIPPDQIALTFDESFEVESASVQLLHAGDAEVPLAPVQVNPEDANRITARPQNILGVDDFTVVWSARAVERGTLLAGAYPFRTGVVDNPGAAQLAGEWPEPWATVLRWLVFLGTALAAGGFAWTRLLASRPGARGSPPRIGTMTIGALVALLATTLPPGLRSLMFPADATSPLTESLRAMPLGWWLQMAALFVLALLCLGVLASGRAAARLPAALDRVGIAAGLAALIGFSLTSHAAAARDLPAVLLEIAHQWSTAFWVSGLLYLAAGWRGLGTDVARFRTVRWIGGALLAGSVITGLAGAWPHFASLGDLLASHYGLVLAAKCAIVVIVLTLGLLAMIGPRHSTAVRASGSLGTQGLLAAVAMVLAAVLALMAAPGTVVPATLAGVALADVVPVDRATFGAENATIHMLTQPSATGPRTIVVRLTDSNGSPLIAEPAPDVEVNWTFLLDSAATAQTTSLRPDPSGTMFMGTLPVPLAGWWQADVIVTPPGGIASRARFWLVLPDPNITGHGPEPTTDPEAQALFQRGLASLTALHSVRYTQRLGDGGGSLFRTRSAVSAAGERPAAYAESVIDAAGNVVAQQLIVGDRRWLLENGAWVAAAPIPFLTPASWSEAYVDATGFQRGPREEVDGELSQVVTFWQAPRANPAREPAWFAWWVGLASGQVRREAMVSTRHYMVYEYRDFNAPLAITPPAEALATVATPAATPAAGNQSLLP